MGRLAAATAAAWIVATAAPAVRAEPMGVEIAAKGGVMTTNPTGYGVGLRGGDSIASLYFGVGFLYYDGGSITSSLPSGGFATPAGATTTSTYHWLQYGVEFGYDIKPLERLTIRPQVGLGGYSTGGSCSISPPSNSYGCGIESSTYPYVEPGVTGMIRLGRLLFVGLDVNLLLVPADSQVHPYLTAHGQIGVTF